MRKVSLMNLGCYKNLVDAEVMLGRLAAAGAVICAEHARVDAMIVNTCCFIRAAAAESSRAIRAALKMKRNGKVKRVVVAGCMAQREGERLRNRFPDVDVLVTLADRERVAELCFGRAQGMQECAGCRTRLLVASEGNPPSPPFAKGGKRLKSPFEKGGFRGIFCQQSNPTPECAALPDAPCGGVADRGRYRLTPPHFAYLRIAEGCSNCCSYCVVPSLRGPYRSKPEKEILREARELLASGARELILIAQDTAQFGVDSCGSPRAHRLLEGLAALQRVRWIRLLYAHPANITREFIRALAKNAKVVKYLDVPIQHASDRVLRLMRRRTTGGDLKKLIETLREQVPRIALRTSVIVGFPGETVRDFEKLLRFVEWAKFERLGAFTYSREKGTPAAAMPDQVPAAEKKNRLHALMTLQAQNAFDYHESLIGSKVHCIVDGVWHVPPRAAGQDRSHAVSAGGVPRNGALHVTQTHPIFLGRTYADAPEVDGTITIEGTGLRPGDIVNVRVTAATTYDLHGAAEPQPKTTAETQRRRE